MSLQRADTVSSLIDAADIDGDFSKPKAPRIPVLMDYSGGSCLSCE
jgi:hypothetical protein